MEKPSHLISPTRFCNHLLLPNCCKAASQPIRLLKDMTSSLVGFLVGFFHPRYEVLNRKLGEGVVGCYKGEVIFGIIIWK